MASVVVIGGFFSMLVDYAAPAPVNSLDWSDFPLHKGEWRGFVESVSPEAIALLDPEQLFSARYFNKEQVPVSLFFDHFSGVRGGPHSPLNCMPASGWTIQRSEPREIAFDGRTFTAKRLFLTTHEQGYIMDFWYVTAVGETANDYALKLYEALTSLLFKQRQLTFVRVMAPDSPAGRDAIDQFEADFLSEIYGRLPMTD
jgi:EpsI family protein